MGWRTAAPPTLRSWPGGPRTNWAESRAETVRQWRGIRDALGEAHPTDLLSEINLICSLCTSAIERRDAGEAPDSDKCAYCIAYHQMGGCRQVCAEISTRIAERDWEAARNIAEDFIGKLESLEIPSEPPA